MLATSSRLVTHYLTEDPNHFKVKQMKKTYDSVLTLDWLLEVLAAGDLDIQKRPKHWAYITPDRKNQVSTTDRYGDP
jgi:hypothetical protein